MAKGKRKARQQPSCNNDGKTLITVDKTVESLKSDNNRPKKKKSVIPRTKKTKNVTKDASVEETAFSKLSVMQPVTNKTSVTKLQRTALVKGFVEHTLKKRVIGLVAEFRGMKRGNDFTKMTEFLANNPLGRNRYKDVGCLDNSRVILSTGPVSYIHANYVATPNNPRKFICTQAPVDKTCADFWYMIYQEKTTAILMLCNFMEMGMSKCAKYFPEDQGTVEFGDTQEIKVVEKSKDEFKFNIDTKVKLITRQLEVTILGQGTHNCTHYHWTDWPDRGVPEADLAPIILLNHFKDITTAPIVVHCSAGIGRTGSIVLIEHVLELLLNNQPIEPISTYLLELRKQRNNSVQTEQQYLYVHQVMLVYLKKNKYLDNNTVTNAHLDIFTKDYKKNTNGF